jgi:hypothetical protein
MRMTATITLVLCSLLLSAAPAAAGPFVPELATRWLSEAAPVGAGPQAIELDAQMKKRTKKGSGSSKKSGRSSRSGTLEYGAMSGRVAPMDSFVGIGVQLGAPTGVTGKLMLDKFGIPQLAVEGGMGFGVGWGFLVAFSTYLDVVYHPHVLARSDSFRLSWFVGAGAWFGFAPLNVFATRGNQEFYFGFNYFSYFGLPWYGTSLAMRIPFGLSLALVNLPIEIYGGLVPSILVFPAIGGGIGGTVGIRFWL